MKTLLLLRHARPTRTSPTGRDFDRPLTVEGRAESRLVGQLLRRRQLAPDAIICSTAARARETAGGVIEAAGLATPTLFHERIYEASVEHLIELIAEAGANVEMLLIVGHNPGLEELLERLTGEHAPMLPATLARIDLNIHAWDELRRAARQGRLLYALSPQAT